MTFKIVPRTRENVSTTGSGATISLIGATGADVGAFSLRMADLDTTIVCILSGNLVDWEECVVRYNTSGNTLTVLNVIANSAGGTTQISLTGTSRVFGIIPNDISVLFDNLFGNTRGSILFRTAANWISLSPGRAGKRLVVGASGDLIWEYAAGNSLHGAVSFATTAALPACTYANGVSGVGATLTANVNAALGFIDGIDTSGQVGHRLMVKNQAASTQNGVYVLTQAGDGTHTWILTRATDFDQGTGDPDPYVGNGHTWFIDGGTLNGGTMWLVRSDISPSIIGTSQWGFSQLAGVNATGAANYFQITAPSDKDVLYYVNADGKFENISLTGLLDSVFGSTRGAILTRGASAWAQLNPGATAGNVLTTAGTGADLLWAAAAAGGMTISDLGTYGANSAYSVGNVVTSAGGRFLNISAVAAADHWDTAFGPTFTYSNSNRTVSVPTNSAGTPKTAISVASQTTGKIYFEMTVDQSTGSDNLYGVAAATISNINKIGLVSNTLGWQNTNQQWLLGGVGTASGIPAVAAGKTIAFAIDLSAGKAWIANVTDAPGTWYGNAGVGNPAAGTNGFSFTPFGVAECVAFTNNQNGTAQTVTVNVGNALYLGTIPSGFSSWSFQAPQYDTTHWMLIGTILPATNGQLLIGDTSVSGAALATLSAGTGITITNAAHGITIAAASGGTNGLFSSSIAIPTLASCGLATWANQGSASVADSAAGVVLHSTSNGGAQNYRIRYKAALTTPYKIKTLVSVLSNLTANYAEVAIGWYDGTKLHLIKVLTAGGSDGGIYLIVQGYSTVAGASITTYFTAPNNNRLPWQNWLQIQDDGTNVHFSFSTDGVQFIDIYSVAKSSGFLGASGYSNVFFGINAYGTEMYGTLMSYAEA